MRLIRSHLVLASALFTLTATVALADSLVTTNGDLLVGPIRKTAAGYTVQTANGPVDVTADNVKRILYDHPPAAAPVKAASTATPTAIPANASRGLKILLAQGEASLAAGEYRDAFNSFTDAIKLDPQNGLANRGAGFSALKLDNPSEAVKPLEVAARVLPLDRSLAVALASSLVATHNPVRAAKILQSYFTAHPTPLDEPALNALGISLSQVDSSAAKESAAFDSAMKLYTKLDADLDATQPGKKRWGIDWLPADEADSKQQARQTAQKIFDDADTALRTATAAAVRAKSQMTAAKNASVTRQNRDQEIQLAQQHLASAQDKQRKAQQAVDDATAALAGMSAPNFPDAISLTDVDFSMNPGASVAAAGTVAPAVPAADTAKPDDATSPTTHPAVAEKWVPGMPVPVDMDHNTPATDAVPPADPPAPAEQHGTRYGVAFAIAPDLFVTANSVVDGATDIEVQSPTGHNIQAEVLRAHAGEGLALLKLKDANFPCLAVANTAASGQLTCVSFPDVDLFNPLAKVMPVTAPTQSDKWSVRLETGPRLPGGPLMKDGQVVGVELTERDSDPSDIPAQSLKALQNLIQDDAKPGMQVTKDPRQAVMQVTADH